MTARTAVRLAAYTLAAASTVAFFVFGFVALALPDGLFPGEGHPNCQDNCAPRSLLFFILLVVLTGALWGAAALVTALTADWPSSPPPAPLPSQTIALSSAAGAFSNNDVGRLITTSSGTFRVLSVVSKVEAIVAPLRPPMEKKL